MCVICFVRSTHYCKCVAIEQLSMLVVLRLIGVCLLWGASPAQKRRGLRCRRTQSNLFC